MSLLPLSAKVKDQQFAELYDIQSRVDYSDIAPDPLTCHISLLPHIALQKGANIDNMLESEARQYLSTFTKKTIGTAGAVEDAINVCFDDAELIEWFDDENLKKGMFKVSVDLKDNVSLVYDERLFSLSRRLINESKNVRSKLDAFDLKINSEGSIFLKQSAVTTIKTSNNIFFDYLHKNTNISANTVYEVLLSNEILFELANGNFIFENMVVTTINLKKEFTAYKAIGTFNNKFATTTTVNIANNSDINLSADCSFKKTGGGVIDVRLDNQSNYKSEVDMNLKIIGGVVWEF